MPTSSATSKTDATTISKSSKSKRRCGFSDCKKRLGLTQFDCRCEGTFCTRHRNPSEHNCTYNHQKRGRELLSAVNNRVVADKVQRI